MTHIFLFVTCFFEDVKKKRKNKQNSLILLHIYFRIQQINQGRIYIKEKNMKLRRNLLPSRQTNTFVIRTE